nr:hypothetical protein HmN_000814700 [Hymenolepis microstoma]
MNRNIGFVLLACLVLLLLILSLGVPKWPCPGHILGTDCIRNTVLKNVGILLATATVTALLVAIFLLFVILQGSTRMLIAALVAVGITALLAMAASFHYANSRNLWCPILAPFGAGIALGLFVTLLFEYRS